VGLYFSGGPVARQIGYDLWQYNMYDAYRDAKPAIRRYKDHNVFQNYVATFNPANLWDPIGAPIFATGAVIGAGNNYAGIRNPTYIAYYGFVGMGEEALFRGFMFPALSDWLGTFTGAVVSSAAFSLFHATNGSGALGAGPLTFRFIGGMLFAWQAHRNSYDLRKNIFAHSWWDVFVGPGSPDGVRIDGGQMGLRIRY
jgi:membrane protease YdiL (CAAX protease family)